METEITGAATTRIHSEESPYVHRVAAPSRQTGLLKEFRATVKETFFSDEPLRPFKDQTRSRKCVLGVETLFPILKWGRDYSLSKFKGDLIAGLTIASLCIPQMTFRNSIENHIQSLNSMPHSVSKRSRDLAIGPVAVVSLLLGTQLRNEINPSTHPADYLRLAFTATFFAGITQFTLGFFRLGFLIDFLSHAAIVGFMGGAAITIALQQLKGLLGIKNFTTKTDIVSVMRSVWSSVHHGWNWPTIVIGVSFLALLLFAKYIGKKKKKLFWVAAIAPLISVIMATFLVYITHADKHGVQIEAIAIGRTFAGAKDYQLDGNKEMVALGTMNVIGSLTSCYVTTGSFSRSAVNFMAGCNTAVSNMVMSCVVLLTLEVLTPLFKYTPNAILASVIISAVVGLIDVEAAILIWKIDKFDFVACMGAFFGVVFVSVEIGLLIAVAISFAKILLQVTRPRTALLGKLPRTSVYRNIQQYPDALKIPGVLIVRVDSAIYFSNSNYIKERETEVSCQSAQVLVALGLCCVVLCCVKAVWYEENGVAIFCLAAVTDIDTSGINALEELYKSLQKKEIQLVIANPGQVVIEKLHASGFATLIGDDKIFLTVADAVQTCAPTTGTEEP
ncbi:Sulfate transporter 1.3 [Sarracenia purpurea var. burkii]